MHDAIAAGRSIRVLSVVDAFTRECLALEVDTSFASRRVTRVLDEIIAERGEPLAIRCDPTTPIGSMKTAWTTCRKKAGVWCRLHDLRPTFISELGEAGVPESTMKAIAGWMSAKMLERYSHARKEAKCDAVSKLPKRRPV